jgi:AcrR family transcriptional regulator
MSKQPRAEETHRRILDAALDAFARQGYDATGVAEICHRAGVTKGGFYHHFHSKQDVFLELLERWLKEIDTQMAAARAVRKTVPEGLMGMTEMIERVFQVAGGRLPLFLEFLTQAAHSPVFGQATAVPIRRYVGFFSDMVAGGIADGDLRPVDPDVVARVLLAFAMGLLTMGLVDPFGANWGEVARQGMQTLLAGLSSGQPRVVALP